MRDRTYSDLSLYRRLLKQARPYWLHIAGIFALSLLASPLALLVPLPLKLAVDSVIGDEPLPHFLEAILPAGGALLFVVGFSLGLALLNQVHSLGSSILCTYTGEKLVRDFRAQLLRHMQRLSLAYHDTTGTADSIYRIQRDAVAIQYISIEGVIPFISAGVTVLSMLYVTMLIDWQLALVAVAVSPVLAFVSGVHRKLLRRGSRQVKQIESTTQAVVQEVLGAARVVKAFAQEDREHQRYVRHSIEGLQANVRLALLEGRFGLLLGLTTAAGTAAVLYIGVGHVKAGIITLGQLLMVMGYLTQLYSPLKTISRKAGSLQSHLASAERAFSILDEVPDVAERPNARSLDRAAGAVVFDNITFAYGPNPPVLRDISFELEAGTRVGVAGTTGAGKTTLVSLLTRFYDPTSGAILLDGVDLRDYKLADLRNQFAIVLQEPVLFSTSLAENIAYARPGATEQEIIEAARLASVHEFISRLPEGYETQVGERGLRLSGGERQRISIARAFLKNAPILILDEPTSSVDMRTEAAIVEAMERLMQGRTTFIIAHRLSTLQSCEFVLKIEDGCLKETVIPESISGIGPVAPDFLEAKVG